MTALYIRKQNDQTNSVCCNISVVCPIIRRFYRVYVSLTCCLTSGVYAKSTHAAELPHQVPRRLSDPSPPSVPSTTFGPASAPPQPVVVGENNNDLPAGADKADFSCNNNYDSAIKQLGMFLHILNK